MKEKLFHLLFIYFLVLPVHGYDYSRDVVLKLVKKEISEKSLISGVSKVQELAVKSCSDLKCDLTYMYRVNGCLSENCYRLECRGTIIFDKPNVAFERGSQECFDL